MNGYDYIKSYYGFPAKRGLVVEYEGKRGVVTGTHAAYLKVKLDGEKFSKCYHPDSLTWENLEVGE